MIIKLEDINNRGAVPIFVGSRRRLATATGVALLDSKRLVATSLVGHRMYLFEYDFPSRAHTLIGAIPTEYQKSEIRTDLIDFNGKDLIVTSNCESNSMSLYRVFGDELSHIKDIPIRDPYAHFCHGANFVPGWNNTLCASCSNSKTIYFISTETTEVLHQFRHGEWKPKDVCFLDDRRMIVVYVKGNPTKVAVAPYQSKLALVEFDLQNQAHHFAGETLFQQTHMDSCRFHAGKIYINNQAQDTVLICRLIDNQIVFEREIDGFSFPHGLDVFPESNLLAVTNYGTNTIVLTKLD